MHIPDQLRTRLLAAIVWALLVSWLPPSLASVVAAPADATIPDAATAIAGGATWITVHSPFGGDANNTGYTVYEYSAASNGPWSSACGTGVPGESAWRGCTVRDLSPNTYYFVRVTFVDADGVSGANPQVIGPVHTPAAPVAAATVGTATATVQETALLVAVPVSGDANLNSQVTVDIASAADGPWTTKCGPPASDLWLCRVHGLTSGATYYARVTVDDPDGVSGTPIQILGPIQYTGLTNLALNRSISADPGWGCCGNAAELTDGRIQNPSWTYGYAWCGGTGSWGGCEPGTKHATIDLGSLQTVARFDMWTHDSNNLPTAWRVEVSADGSAFTPVFESASAQCRAPAQALTTSWSGPNCAQHAEFSPVPARYVRYSFDDQSLLGGIHGWAVELEVFGAAQPPAPVSDGFDEEFDSANLDPAWQLRTFTGTRVHGLSGPANHISLTDSPGHLRYLVDPMTHADGFLNGYQTTFGFHSCCNHDPGLELQRSFVGDHWLLEARSSYVMPFSNGRSLELRVYFGDGGPNTDYVGFGRWRDGPWPQGTPETQPIEIRLGHQAGTTLPEVNLPERVFPVHTPADTYYYQLERSGGVLTARWSTDGTSWNTAFSHDLGAQLDSQRQRVVITGASWFNPAGSYADYDYIRVAPRAALNDDLAPAAGGFWLSPPTIHERDPNAGLGLIVERRGGKTTLADVPVAFYQGDPAAGGTLIGRSTIALLAPRSQQSTGRVLWSLPAGSYTIYAVIDPDHRILEDNETNNVVSRTVTVLPTLADQLAPRVDRFSINDRAPTTSARTVRLSVAASDNPGGSGIARIQYIEYAPVAEVGGWAPVRSSGWLAASAENLDSYLWDLQPTAGLHCLQAWAADQSNNIALAPNLQCINYTPTVARVARGQTAVFRQELRAGQSLHVILSPRSGDADLYVWAPGTPDNGEPPYVSNLSDMAADELTLTAPRAGIYQIEVYGYTDAQYSLEIVPSASGQAAVALRPAAIDPSKPLPGRPALALGNRPADTLGIPAAPRFTIGLPIVLR